MQILGVNEAGFENGNDTITDGRNLPWLQDVPTTNVWDSWSVGYRDVIIVDADNNVTTVYNLSDNDLANGDNYAALKSLLISAAP